jgi:hypothetical protein
MVKNFSVKGILLMCCIVVLINGIPAAASYYVNSYLKDSSGLPTNAVLGIDLASKHITDSLFLNVRGQFVDKNPAILKYNRHEILFTMLFNGLSGKNTQGGELPTTHYFIIDKDNFNLLNQDSLVNKLVSQIKVIYPDTIILTALDFISGWIEIRYLYDGIHNSMMELRRNNEDLGKQDRVYIGNYRNPTELGNYYRVNYYSALNDNMDAEVFSSNDGVRLLRETMVGNVLKEAVIIGFDSSTSRIYTFNFRYKIASMSPPDSSDNSIIDKLLIIDASNFTRVDTILLSTRDLYVSNEYGFTDNIYPYMVYYFADSDCGECYDPAYLLIFDTRTNEAAWLRVGWR